MTKLFKSAAIAIALAASTALTPAYAADPAYFDAFPSLDLERTEDGILTVTMNTDGGPILFTAEDHTDFVEAFYRIGRDRENKVVILTGAGDWMAQIDFSTFGNVADADAWSPVHDEGVQIMENLVNIRVPVIAAIEGKAHIHSEYALTADTIVAAESVTFNDLPHFAGGIVPGDGIFTTWSYRAGPGRATAWLLNPVPIDAETAKAWGVVNEIVPDGTAVDRAKELATLYLQQPEVTRRNTRVHFTQPLKLRLVQEVGYGLALEGASANALVKQMTQSGQ